MVKKEKSDDSSKLLLILLWIFWPVGLIWYLVDEKMNKDTFVKFHFKQWLVAIIASFIWSIAWGIVFTILTIITLGFFAFIGWLGYLLPLVWLIQAIIFIVKGEKNDLWLIGKYAKKFNF
ncbi:MAG: hypothetical protein AB7V77_05440 [Candidatus Woesearchaeota archaeon]